MVFRRKRAIGLTFKCMVIALTGDRNPTRQEVGGNRSLADASGYDANQPPANDYNENLRQQFIEDKAMQPARR